MDRIDILHGIIEKEDPDIFWAREGKLRKVLEDTALSPEDREQILRACTEERKLTKRFLSEPSLDKTADVQKKLGQKVGGKGMNYLKDVHTAIHRYSRKEVSEPTGEFDDGRFVYKAVPARRQCLDLLRPLTPPAYDLVIPDTVTVSGKEWKIVTIADKAFEGCDAIKTVKLPASLETIGKNAFCNCTSLSSVDLPRHLTKIGDNAFAFTALEALLFKDYLEEIGNMAFYRCRKLKTVELPKRTSQIGLGAFAGCSSLETVSVDDKNGRFMFEDGVLYSRKQDRIVQVAGTFRGKLSPPRSLVTIEQYAAEDCAGITELDLPVSVTSIGAYAFRGCTELAKVKFPNTIERIGAGAFSGCRKLTSIDVPASVKTIGKQAFSGCTSLEVGEIGGKISYKGLNVFEGCTGLNRITIRKDSDYTEADFPKNTRIKFTR
ncbi:MAG: leucine-rich repeat domain-containing protein [Candidatus Methanomethylophilus sp.]|nr:leucine-rich repeat domain-containing protein [Methanomethylophilus sp.]